MWNFKIPWENAIQWQSYILIIIKKMALFVKQLQEQNFPDKNNDDITFDRW